MPAPEFNVQTPGDQTANTSTTSASEAPALYVAKHKGAGKWIAVTNDAAATQVGDFVGNKDTIEFEVARLNAGGEPLVLDPQRANEPKAATKAKPSSIDPATIKQPVLTEDGWLCPVPPVKE